MTTPTRLEELRLLEVEFKESKTTDLRRVEILTVLRKYAGEETTYKCGLCRQPGFFVPYGYALIEGHCYTQAGVDDLMHITKVCEYCFDKMHQGMDSYSVPEVGPRDA